MTIMNKSLALFVFSFVLGNVNLVSSAKTVTEIIDTLFPEKEKSPSNYYDKGLRPNYGDKPVKVTVSAYVLDVFDIDEKKHEFTAQLYFRQRWVDPRLKFEPPPEIQYITLDAELSKKLWIPDTFIVNERSSFKHDLTVENVFTRLYKDGEVLQSRRITVTASCNMNLKWFPFDRHTCSLLFESYGQTAKEFYYEWALNEDGKPQIGISEGAGGSINQEVRAIKGVTAMPELTFGIYSRLGIDMLITRVSTRYLQDVYFPATVIVIIALITMSVGPPQFRVLLSLICMAAIVIFTSLLSMEMPKVSYQTALDFYVFKCSFMVFNVVIVNFIMYHLLKPRTVLGERIRMRQLNGIAEDGKEHILPDTEGSEDFNIGRPVFESRLKGIIYTCCKYSQYTMPCFFLVFNIIYWMVVLIGSNSVGNDTDFMLLENTES